MKALVTADWHLRSTVPSCCTMSQEEWFEVQEEAIGKVEEIAEKEKVELILHDGDLFHSEVTATNQVIQIPQRFSERMWHKGIPVYYLCGNHDLINHSSSTLYRSAMGTFLNSKYVLNMKDCPYVKGCSFDEDDYSGYKMIAKHTLIIPSDSIPFGVTCDTPESILERYPEAQWIFTGDYHKNFHYEKNGRHVVNPGCLTRQASDFEDYIPGVYVVDTDSNTVTFHSVLVDQVFNSNGKEKKELDRSIEEFAMSIKKQDVTLDYVSSLRNEIRHHEKPVQEKVEEWITGSGQ